MLVTIDELATERLVASEAGVRIAQRHAQYYADLVNGLTWEAERQIEWADRLGVEAENLRVAIRWFWNSC